MPVHCAVAPTSPEQIIAPSETNTEGPGYPLQPDHFRRRTSVDVPSRKHCRSPLGSHEALTRLALAPVERKMVRMLAHGFSPRIIAERLALGESSLRACLDSVFAKLAMSGQLGLLAGAEARDRRGSFSFVRKAHRLTASRNNPDPENEMQVA